MKRKIIEKGSGKGKRGERKGKKERREKGRGKKNLLKLV